MSSSDADRLLRNRRKQSAAIRDEGIVDRSEADSERDRTGSSYRFSGRDPQTGEVVLRSSRSDLGSSGGQIRTHSLSNGDISAPGTPLQFVESESRLEVNHPPSPKPAEDEPQQPGEDPIGVMSVLFDTVVQGDATPSCTSIQDAWALYAIVQWVRAPRVMVLFSFPVETGAPVPYTCPRYVFRMDVGGGYVCAATPDPGAPYGTLSECRMDNPVSCGTGLVPGGLPLEDNGYPEGSSLTCSTGFQSRHFFDQNVIESKDRTVYRFDTETSTLGLPYSTYDIGLVTHGTVSNLERVGTVFARPISSRFFSANNRTPRCGDTISFNAAYVDTFLGSQCMARIDGDQVIISKENDLVSPIRRVVVTFSYQRTGGNFLTWFAVSRSNGCGDYDRAFPSVETPPPDAPSLPGGECDPEEKAPSTVRRKFYVGGHIREPIELPITLNEEDEYEAFATLTADGYRVTIKHGREVVGGKEQWCTVSVFSTTNLIDWRTESYVESTELSPASPSNPAANVLTLYGGRGNLSEDGTRYSIDPEQSVTSITGGTRALSAELLVRSSVGVTEIPISAIISYQPDGGTEAAIPAEIYRIDSVIPTDLDDIVGGCFEIGGVDLQYSPLFLVP